MKPAKFVVLLLFLSGLHSSLAQDKELLFVIDSLLQNKTSLDRMQSKMDDEIFIQNLSGLRNSMANESKQFSGEISFGLNGQEVDHNNFFSINTGVNMSSGTYPFKFEFNSGFLAQIRNGAFSESVSTLSISFDYNYSKKNLSKQSYVFLNGTNNSFLEIDQRYEIGGGFILNYYSGSKSRKKDYSKTSLFENKKSGLTQKGLDKLRAINGNKKSVNDNDLVFKQGLENTLNSSSVATEGNLRALEEERSRLVNTIIKNFSTTRLSLLAGLNYELERTADSMGLFNRSLQRNRSFDATNRFRLVVRPGVDWKGENFSFSSKAYFKFGVFDEFYSEITQESFNDKKADYWIQWNNSLQFNFSESIGLKLSYILFYDNAVNRAFIDIGSPTVPDILLFKAEDTFTAVLLSFTYGM